MTYLLDKILEQSHGSKKHIVFVDGYIRGLSIHSEISRHVHDWVKVDRDNRRLVLLCSMSAHGKISAD